jgi:hypothetical protein
MPAKLPTVYTRAELADPAPLLPKPRPTDPRQLALKPMSTMPAIVRPPKREPSPHLEKSIERAIRLELAKDPDVLLWRHSAARPMTDEQGNFFRAGLPQGAPDLIGILRITDVVAFGAIGRFFALEVRQAKRKKRDHHERQFEFHALIRRFNGFVAVVTSVEEALAALERARGGACE